MRVLVTGASGFIGSAVVRRLTEQGHAVRCLLRPTSRTERIAAYPFETAIGDLEEPETLRPATRGCDGVIHLASISNWVDIHADDVVSVGIGGTKALLDAALETNCRRFVYISSTVAAGGSPEPEVRDEAARPGDELDNLVYAAMKFQAEQLCLNAGEKGLETVIVNPSEVYGPGDRDLITAGNLIDFAQGPVTLVCDGGTGVAYLDDVAAGIVAALERGRPGERYFLSSENLTNRDIAVAVLETLERNNLILPFPRPVVRGLAWLGMNCKLPLPFNPAIAPYVTLYWFVSNDKARRELGVEFRPAREAIAEAVRWLQAEGLIT